MEHQWEDYLQKLQDNYNNRLYRETDQQEIYRLQGRAQLIQELKRLPTLIRESK